MVTSSVVDATWSAHGYVGEGSVVSLLDSLPNRPAIVVGSAYGVFDEVSSALRSMGDKSVIFATNDAGMYLSIVHHWVSLHVGNLLAWKSIRCLHHDDDIRLHSISFEPGIDYAWVNLTPTFALSGYFAMQIAYLMGCNPIILCGCPGDNTRRFYEATPRTFDYSKIQEQVVTEMTRLPNFKLAVRSMSGWTKDFFGGI